MNPRLVCQTADLGLLGMSFRLIGVIGLVCISRLDSLQCMDRANKFIFWLDATFWNEYFIIETILKSITFVSQLENKNIQAKLSALTYHLIINMYNKSNQKITTSFLPFSHWIVILIFETKLTNHNKVNDADGAWWWRKTTLKMKEMDEKAWLWFYYTYFVLPTKLSCKFVTTRKNKFSQSFFPCIQFTWINKAP